MNIRCNEIFNQINFSNSNLAICCITGAIKLYIIFFNYPVYKDSIFILLNWQIHCLYFIY